MVRDGRGPEVQIDVPALEAKPRDHPLVLGTFVAMPRHPTAGLFRRIRCNPSDHGTDPLEARSNALRGAGNTGIDFRDLGLGEVITAAWFARSIRSMIARRRGGSSSKSGYARARFCFVQRPLSDPVRAQEKPPETSGSWFNLWPAPVILPARRATACRVKNAPIGRRSGRRRRV